MNTRKPENQDCSNAEAMKVFVRAIVSLIPMEARCLLNTTYVEAMIFLGKDWEEVLDAPKDLLRKTCVHCRQLASQKSQTAA